MTNWNKEGQKLAKQYIWDTPTNGFYIGVKAGFPSNPKEVIDFAEGGEVDWEKISNYVYTLESVCKGLYFSKDVSRRIFAEEIEKAKEVGVEWFDKEGEWSEPYYDSDWDSKFDAFAEGCAQGLIQELLDDDLLKLFK